MRSLEVKLTTEDGLQIAGKYIPGSLPLGIVLVHMMPSTKESFDQLAEKLAETGFHTLAIDLRGHGQSQGGDYQNFTDQQHQNKIKDLAAAVDYLRKQNPDITLGFVGASIGANLSLQYATMHPAKFVVLLSAGLNYYGVDAFKFSGEVAKDLPVYFVSARDDERKSGNNATMTEQLYNNCASSKKFIKIYQEGGHGTDLLNFHPELEEELITWIEEATQ